MCVSPSLCFLMKYLWFPVYLKSFISFLEEIIIDDFNSLIARCRTYLKKTDVEDNNLNKISRKRSCRNNIFLHYKKQSTEFPERWYIDSEN